MQSDTPIPDETKRQILQRVITLSPRPTTTSAFIVAILQFPEVRSLPEHDQCWLIAGILHDAGKCEKK